MIKKIIKESDFEMDKLYLLEKISEEYGFFYQNNVVYFAHKSNDSNEDLLIETQFLDMNLYVYLSNISGKAEFEDGYYDLLSFKGDIDSIYFDTFYNICNSYVWNQQGLSFSNFFNNLVELFQIQKETNSNNLIGLIGELLFIKYVYEKTKKIIISNWHKVGEKSKFDFSFDKFNLEVKSTTKSDSKFKIKHNQIFNNQKNYISVINLIETGDGFSLNTLFDYYTSNEVFSRDIVFQIKISKELLKYPRLKERSRSFVIDSIETYAVDDMEKISEYPSCISNLTYDYDFSETPVSNIIDVLDV